MATWGSGGTPSRSEPNFYGGSIPWIKSGELNARYVKSTEENITEAAVSGSSAKIFPAGSVAIAMYGATIGKTAILGVDAATNQACAVGAPIEGLTSSEFLYRLLQNEKDAFIEKGKGGAQPNISQAVIKAHEVSLPPLAEQTRIAQKLDELLAQVDTLKARIDGIPALLKRFRQSVLAAAVSGRLTEEWRHHLGIPNPTDGKLSDCIEAMIGGASPKTTDYSAAGMLALNKGDIKEYGRVEIKQNPKYVPFEFVEINSKKVILDRTVLVTLRDLSQKADFLGLIGRYRGEQPALITQGMYGLKVNPRVAIEDYLIAFSNSPQYRTQVKREKVGATQVHLRNGQFLDFAVPIFVIEEQTEIVRRVEQLFAFADQLEAKVASAKSRIDHLTQSILAKAFRGELVPQDPNDEPASVLLERIKAQRAAAPKAKRGRKASA
ncbi:restriction endonuclease subunit S [Stutzerimonas nitrititolerans]|uniref:restriction endonuclease subunit S n=1 Tax=Stutzerimonas nitrititolerans TaxID=2482751 RepID=UPI0028A6366A|nr:restriction endonuclease subunit S [Stutzerimonas nitrititolerans]